MVERLNAQSNLLPGPAGVVQHAERPLLLGELHARPFLPLPAPRRIYHFAFMTGEDEARADRVSVAQLAAARGLAPPPPDAKYQRYDFGTWELRWEQHTEFTTYTWLTAREASEPFMHADPLREGEISFTPPGPLIAAVHMSLIAPEHLSDDPTARFNPQGLCVIDVSEGSARLTTDFQVDPQGFTRFLIESKKLTPTRAGRLVQRVLELETYRVLALLGLPEARRTGPELSRMERELSEVTNEIAGAVDPKTKQRMLQKLTRLAAEIEAQTARTAFRFGASRAYYAQVKSRIELIRERQEGEYVTITAFFRRRLEPAIETCNAVEARQARLSSQLARTADLLRTGIQFELEHQNRDLLASMDKRAQLQLRLQQTVEGLSVAAISYYVVGLITYLAKGVKDVGILPKPVTPEMVTAAAVPVVVLVMWVLMKRLHRHIAGGGH